MVDVVHYAEPVRTKGFVVMDTPGYDPVSMTGIVAGGANVCVFTTGRGSVFGCKPSPSIKIATNSPLYNHMLDDMDINAGVILEGTPVEIVGQQIFEEILAVASRQENQERDQRRRRGGVRPVVDRADSLSGFTNHRGTESTEKIKSEMSCCDFLLYFSVPSVPLWFPHVDRPCKQHVLSCSSSCGCLSASAAPLISSSHAPHKAAHFRLPSQHANLEARSSFLVVLLALARTGFS